MRFVLDNRAGFHLCKTGCWVKELPKQLSFIENGQAVFGNRLKCNNYHGKEARLTHVLFIPSWYKSEEKPRSGFFFFEQARVLAENGLEVGLVYSERVSTSRLFRFATLSRLFFLENRFDAGIRTLRNALCYPNWGGLGFQVWVSGVVHLFREYVRRWGRPDIIHAQSALWGGVAARRIQQETGIPYVVTEHASFIALDTIPIWSKPFVRDVYEDARALFAVSSTLAGDIKRLYNLQKIFVVPNLVDTTFFSAPSSPRIGAPFRFLSIGRFVPIKNLKLAIAGFAKAFPNNEDVFLELCGGGKLSEELKTQAERLGLSDRVLIRDKLSRSEVREAMWRADAYVSTSDYETFGVTLIEALATGLPVISTCSGGPNDIVTDGMGGLIPVNDADALASAMQRIRTESICGKSAEMAGSRRQKMVSDYSSSVFYRTMEGYYRRILRAEGT